MTRPPFRSAALLLPLWWACTSNQPVTPPLDDSPPTFRLVESNVWAGATLRIRSDRAMQTQHDARIWFDGSALTIYRTDDTTLTIAIPPTRNGAFEAAMVFDGDSTYLGTVHVFGITETFTINSAVNGYIPFTELGRQYLASLTSNGVSVIDVEARTVTNSTIPGTLGSFQRLSPTSTAGVFVVRAGKTATHSVVTTWRLLPSPVMEATYSFPGAFSYHDATILSPDVVIFEANNTLVRQKINPASSLEFPTFGAASFSMSPNRDRVFQGRWSEFGPPAESPHGIPVFEVPSGTHLFTMSGSQVGTLAFSPDGSEIAYGTTEITLGELEQLRVIRSSNGSVRASISLTGLASAGLSIGSGQTAAFDSNGEWLLIGSGDLTGVEQEALVFDGSTLELLGRIRLPTTSMGSNMKILGAIDGSMYLYRLRSGVLTFYKVRVPSKH